MTMFNQRVLDSLRAQRIEVPCWMDANSGVRFKNPGRPDTSGTLYDKVDAAAAVHRFTGVAPSLALRISPDRDHDYSTLAKYAADQGLTVGTVYASTFPNGECRLDGIAGPEPRLRRQAIEHLLECVDVMDQTKAPNLKIWFADGTDYPGQDSIRARQDRLAEALRQVYDRLSEDQRLLLEYNPFETAFYHADVPDWGIAYAHCLELGPKAQVVVDTGHHAPGTNNELITAFLLRAGKLGGLEISPYFHAEDDVTAGSPCPFQLFRIMHEVVQADALAPRAGIMFMLDHSLNADDRVPAVIRSVMNVQEATAKALLIDANALAAAQRADEVLGANAVLMDAYNTDVRPLLRRLREEIGLDPEPAAAYERSACTQRLRAEHASGQTAGER